MKVRLSLRRMPSTLTLRLRLSWLVAAPAARLTNCPRSRVLTGMLSNFSWSISCPRSSRPVPASTVPLRVACLIPESPGSRWKFSSRICSTRSRM